MEKAETDGRRDMEKTEAGRENTGLISSVLVINIPEFTAHARNRNLAIHSVSSHFTNGGTKVRRFDRIFTA
jgi:hypothetical protein